ncbi:MAG: DNA polymerase III subunit beta, partial [Byssovorax sp.]
MDLVIPKKDLLRLVTRCQGVADKKSAMPALANVLLSAEGNALRVAATDLYLAVSGQTHADVATAGSVAVPAKDLLERVKAMPDGPVQIISGEGAQTTLKAVGSPRRYTLHGIPGSEFPQLPKPAPDAPSLELPVELLSLLITRTHFSISSDETRPNVNSGLFEWSGDRVRLVSTDGHRLSKMEATVTGSAATATMLIPLKAISELRRLADEAKSEKDATTVTITQSGPNAFFGIAGMTFSVKLVDAQ